ncbi:hypothetical protein [Microbacterium sp. NPDC076895]|uniref:hypothetical protein n=1 Tax=Microbacterium sp. NPDC076895 TaxID=3154957 RepID=UPI003443D332
MTNEQQPNQPLTRRQLRELRSTGATPILTPEGTPIMPPSENASPTPAPVQTSADTDANQDAEQAPVSADSAEQASAGGGTDNAAEPAAPADSSDDFTSAAADASSSADELPGSSPTGPTVAADGAPLTRRRVRERTGNTDALTVSGTDGDHRAPFISVPPASPEEHAISQAAAGLASDEPVERGTVSPQLGSALLAGMATEPDPRPSFDQLISRPSAGATGTGSALIMTDSPPQGITAPVNATGEVLVTGSLALPDLFATTGQMPGASEGLDIDATYADGELPQHSSPTPIAASAAVSTVKTTAEIIKPPAPEKGSRLMLTLAITAGVLALALVGVLILAFATGVFS